MSLKLLKGGTLLRKFGVLIWFKNGIGKGRDTKELLFHASDGDIFYIGLCTAILWFWYM